MQNPGRLAYADTSGAHEYPWRTYFLLWLKEDWIHPLFTSGFQTWPPISPNSALVCGRTGLGSSQKCSGLVKTNSWHLSHAEGRLPHRADTIGVRDPLKKILDIVCWTKKGNPAFEVRWRIKGHLVLIF